MEKDVTWVLQINLIDQKQVSEIASAVLRDGAKVIGVNVIPFQDHVDMDELPVTKNVFPYGSTKLSKLVAGDRNWNGICFNDNFSAIEWNKNRDDMLNAECIICAVKDVTTIFEGVDESETRFIRPVHDLKVFAGAVTTVREIKNWMKSTDSGNFSFTEDTLVSIAHPQNIEAEWRWFVVNGQVIDGSMYRAFGTRNLLHIDNLRMVSEAQTIADKWLPHPTCVMDLALLDDGSMKVIEFNCINSSGFYDHDIPKIVKAINDSFTSEK